MAASIGNNSNVTDYFISDQEQGPTGFRYRVSSCRSLGLLNNEVREQGMGRKQESIKDCIKLNGNCKSEVINRYLAEEVE